MEDSQIVDLFLARDEDALQHTAQIYGPRLRRLSQGIVGDAETAEECENDTYLQAWQRIPPQEPRNYLFAFLARITRNLSIDRCRHRDRMKRNALIVELSAELECCIPAPEDTQCRMEGRVLAKAISTYLKSLPEAQRNVFVRRYWFADSVADIARRYHMTQSKVKSILFRSRSGLRAFLEKEGYVL